MNTPSAMRPVEIGLTAAIVAMQDDQPVILVARSGSALADAALPTGPFDPIAHRTFEIGLRAWVNEQTSVRLGYVEQLYTFGDRGRHAHADDTDPHVVSVGYLALTRIDALENTGAVLPAEGFQPWYRFFPWEDFRNGRPQVWDEIILPALYKWSQHEPKPHGTQGLSRADRIRLLCGLDGARFDEENVLERYELFYEAGIVAEAGRDARASATSGTDGLGAPLRYDHRRILATAMGRLRAKIKYRPVIFELMAQNFTLTALQRTAEAISGRHLHKQNFRRLVETSAVVEPTGETSHATGGRPAALFRFRRDVLQERPALGLRVGAR
jgi:hypothetical protein